MVLVSPAGELLGETEPFQPAVPWWQQVEDFGPGLQAIADLLVPQVVPLEGAPADPRLLVVNVVRGGETIACPLVPGCASPGSCGEGAVFTPAAGGEPARLSFQGPCRLHAGDRIDVRVLCAG